MNPAESTTVRSKSRTDAEAPTPDRAVEGSMGGSAGAAAEISRNGAREELRAVAPDFKDSALYVNRELALIEFNLRVLEQAKDPATPLLERLRFLTICSTNLDEFFEIRASGVKQQIAFHVTQAGSDGLTPVEVMRRISESAHALVAEQYRVLNE